jgi:hypothetical protein
MVILLKSVKGAAATALALGPAPLLTSHFPIASTLELLDDLISLS